ncbi:YqcI/YcgG family protein [Pseudomonas putida]|jgi:FPC/CPF motif-containing protein YcgG|uniref:YqcI/YcgG family protein n=1 Tax=Pseudomonas jessenii TaxID=77298 RepID=A0A5C4KY57_PSEJE|nr:MULTISPECIES: YqcI/YcgG family protein [Pseudomonas]TNB95878.1 YqcI/YcgG family protein [Pseudomonas jessenii]
MRNFDAQVSYRVMLSQDEINHRGAGWEKEALNELEERLGAGSDFPCIFSKNAFKKSSIKFVFVDTLDAQGLAKLAEGLKEYVTLSRTWSGSIEDAYPLIVFFSTDAISASTAQEYQAAGWGVLQSLHWLDESPWPDSVDVDPESPFWSMCFAGMQLFVNMSSPAHKLRKSRNLGSRFALVINPRERFDVFAGDTVGGRNVRANIRKRILKYDSVPHALQLGGFGSDAKEWWQYGLIEENAERTDVCPFKHSSHENKEEA